MIPAFRRPKVVLVAPGNGNTMGSRDLTRQDHDDLDPEEALREAVLVPQTDGKAETMERRVLLLFEPAPLICMVGSRGQGVMRDPGDHAAATWWVTSLKQIEQDLLHQRHVMNDVFQFCLHHRTSERDMKEMKEAGKSEAPVLGDMSNQRDAHDRTVLLAAVCPFPTEDSVNRLMESCSSTATSGDSDSKHTIRNRSEDGQGSEYSSRDLGTLFELSIAEVFASVLDGCGVWMTPDEFEARVLVPTTDLIEAQLNRLRSAILCTYRGSGSGPDRPFVGAGGDKASRCSSPGSAASERLKVGRPDGQSPGGHAGDTSDVDLTRSEPRGAEMEIGNPEGSSSYSPCMERCISSAAIRSSPYSASSPTRGGSSPATEGPLPSSTESPSRERASSNISLTAPTAGSCVSGVEDGRPTVLTETLEQTRAYVRHAAEEIGFLVQDVLGGESSTVADPERGTASPTGRRQSRSLVGEHPRVLFDILWLASCPPRADWDSPALLLRQQAPGESPNTVGVAEEPGSSESSTRRSSGSPYTVNPHLTLSIPVENPLVFPLREALETVRLSFPYSTLAVWPTADADPTARFPAELAEESRTLPAEVRRAFWASWCSTLRAGFFEASASSSGHGIDVLKCGGTSSSSSSAPAEQARPAATDPGVLWRGGIAIDANARETATSQAGAAAPPNSGSVPPHIGGLLSIKGFALRASGPVRRRGGDVRATSSSRPDAALRVGCETTKILRNCSAFRLARVVSPMDLVRVCHLLADNVVAPGLELSVFDPQRFPGSVALLGELALQDSGMLLVSSAEYLEDPAMKNGSGLAEGLAMVCFPHPFVGEGQSPTWSVTLFRRHADLSQEAIAALVGDGRAAERYGCAIESTGNSGRGDHGEIAGVQKHERKEETCGAGVRPVHGEKRGFDDVIASAPHFGIKTLRREVSLLKYPSGQELTSSDDCAAPREGEPSTGLAPRRSGRRRPMVAATAAQSVPSGPLDRVAEKSTPAQIEGSAGQAVKGPPGQPNAPRGLVMDMLNGMVDALGARLSCAERPPEGCERACAPGERRDSLSYRVDALPVLPTSSPDAGGSLAQALYSTFGCWGNNGHLGWAEEELLSTGDGNGNSCDRNAVGESTASVMSDGSRPGAIGEDAPGAAGALGAGPVQGAKRPLSTAEEALERAGQQQRRRIKERRLVAREQRARLERSRSFQGSDTSTHRSSAAGIGGAGGGGANATGGGTALKGGVAPGGATYGGRRGRFQRVLSSPPSTPASLSSRSSLTGKLSRGSLILEKSVEARDAAARALDDASRRGAGACDGQDSRAAAGGDAERSAKSSPVQPVAEMRTLATLERRDGPGASALSPKPKARRSLASALPGDRVSMNKSVVGERGEGVERPNAQERGKRRSLDEIRLWRRATKDERPSGLVRSASEVNADAENSSGLVVPGRKMANDKSGGNDGSPRSSASLTAAKIAKRPGRSTATVATVPSDGNVGECGYGRLGSVDGM